MALCALHNRQGSSVDALKKLISPFDNLWVNFIRQGEPMEISFIILNNPKNLGHSRVIHPHQLRNTAAISVSVASNRVTKRTENCAACPPLGLMLPNGSY